MVVSGKRQLHLPFSMTHWYSREPEDGGCFMVTVAVDDSNMCLFFCVSNVDAVSLQQRDTKDMVVDGGIHHDMTSTDTGSRSVIGPSKYREENE